MMQPWEFQHLGQLTEEYRDANPIASRCYANREDATHFFIKDNEHPYVQEKPFDRSGGPVDSGLSGWGKIVNVGAGNTTVVGT